MSIQHLYDRLDSIERELLQLERDNFNCSKLDSQIFATIHYSLAADLPGLISRLEPKLTSEGYLLTLKCHDLFEQSIAAFNFDDAKFGDRHKDFEFRTRELYTDLLSVYMQNGFGEN